MFFTQEDIQKISKGLAELSIKDTQLPGTEEVLEQDCLAIVQDGKNKKVSVRDFLNNLGVLKKSDFINISALTDNTYNNIDEVVHEVPVNCRKPGLCVTFQDTDYNWKIYQFRGEANQWDVLTFWVDILDYSSYVVNGILPDEEDLTVSGKDEKDNLLLSLKDRKPSEDFVGKGYKILRRNIVKKQVTKTGILINKAATTTGTVGITISGITTMITLTTSDNTVEAVAKTIYDALIDNEKMSGFYITYESNTVFVENKFTLNSSISTVGKTSSGAEIYVNDEDIEVDKNILTQAAINQPNTIYEIRYDFDLYGAEIVIPEDCVLKFEGGSFKNGTLIGSNTKIVPINVVVFSNISINGVWKQSYINDIWFDYNSYNDTKLLHQVFNFQNPAKKKTITLHRDYSINVSTPIEITSNTEVLLNNNTIKVLPNNFKKSVVFHLDNVTNVTITGGIIIGDRTTHTKSAEDSSDEWNHLIKLNGGSIITIKNLILRDATGDGLDLIEWSTNYTDQHYKDVIVPSYISVVNCIFDNNRRNNISIEAGNYVYINGCTIVNAGKDNGTAPMNGIDIEPWREFVDCKNIIISNNIIKDSIGADIQVLPNYWNTDKTIDNCISIINNRCKTFRLLDSNNIQIQENQKIKVVIERGELQNISIDALEIELTFNAGVLYNSILHNVKSLTSKGNFSNVELTLSEDSGIALLTPTSLIENSSIYLHQGSINSFACNSPSLECTFKNITCRSANFLATIAATSKCEGCYFISSNPTMAINIPLLLNCNLQGSTFVLDCTNNDVLLQNSYIQSEYSITSKGSDSNNNKITLQGCIIKTSIAGTLLTDKYKKVNLCSTFIDSPIGKGYDFPLLGRGAMIIDYTNDFATLTLKGPETLPFKTQLYQENLRGDSGQRPNLPKAKDGFNYYDTTLQEYITWDGTQWLNPDGSSIDKVTIL